MVTFFRKIRQKWLNGGDFKKYFFYALGEILLVVVGILIALQINTWNESRKFNARQQFLLGELKDDLLATQSSLEAAIIRHTHITKHIDHLIQNIEQEKAYQLTWDTSFFMMDKYNTPKMATATYETLKAQGLDFIDHKALRDQIRNLYEITYLNLKEVDYALNSNHEHSIVPFLSKHFRNYPGGLTSPNDYENLVQEAELLNILYNLKALKGYSTSRFKQANQKVQALIESLAEELAPD